MKQFKLSSLLAVTMCLQSAFAGGEGWTHDFAAAQKQAVAEGKDLLLDFTGSDWCMPCGMLEKEVFSQEAFKTEAKKKFVLVELDFPKDTSKLSQETLKQNSELQTKYLPAGYPTVVLCKPDGKPYAANSGYVEGGAPKFLELLNSLGSKKDKLDAGLASAAKLEGKAKAQATIDALKESGIPGGAYESFYKEQMDQVRAADPKDEIGYFSSTDKENKFNALQGELTDMVMSGKEKDALVILDANLEKFEGERKQALYMLKALACHQTFKYDEALKALDEIEKLGGGDQVKEGVATLRTQFKAAKEAFDEKLKEMKKEN